MIFPITVLVALGGMVGETYTPGPVPPGAEEGFWVSVSPAAAVQVRETCSLLALHDGPQTLGRGLTWKAKMRICPPSSGEEESYKG